MENTAIIALSRQATLRRQMNVIANNLANMNTSGFKGEKMMFAEHLVRSRGGEQVLGDKLHFVRDIATVRNMTEGALESTGNPLDVAVRGEGFLAVETPEGERYTRNGRLQLDAEGRLVTQQGYTVLDQGGAEIQFGPTDTDVLISADGTISSAEGGQLGKLRVVEFENPNNMQMMAGGLYDSTDAPVDAEQPQVVQGMVEKSNVEPIIEMTRMIEVNRAYSSVKDLIQKEDERIKKMVETYTKVSA